MNVLKIPIGPVHRVGEMRAKLASLPDDEPIYWQVAGADGKAWILFAEAGTAKGGTIFAVVLSHPNLLSLPEGALSDPEAREASCATSGGKCCLHATGRMLMSMPPVDVKRCCHCGEEKPVRLSAAIPAGHGPHFPKYGPH